MLWLEARLGVRASRVVSYHRPAEVRRNLYAKASGVARSGTSLPALAGAFPAFGPGLDRMLSSRPGFHYLWWPGLGH